MIGNFIIHSVLKYAEMINCETTFGVFAVPETIDFAQKYGFKTLYIDHFDEKFFSWAVGFSEDWTCAKSLDCLNTDHIAKIEKIKKRFGNKTPCNVYGFNDLSTYKRLLKEEDQQFERIRTDNTSIQERQIDIMMQNS